LKGKLDVGPAGATVRIHALRSHPLVEEIRSLSGEPALDDDLVRVDDKVKTVLLNGRSVLLVERADMQGDGVRWRTCSRRMLKDY
jgi:hypothetical protein